MQTRQIHQKVLHGIATAYFLWHLPVSLHYADRNANHMFLPLVCHRHVTSTRASYRSTYMSGRQRRRRVACFFCLLSFVSILFSRVNTKRSCYANLVGEREMWVRGLASLDFQVKTCPCHCAAVWDTTPPRDESLYQKMISVTFQSH